MNFTPEQIAARLAERNPFVTRSVRPGVITYRFYDNTRLENLIEQLRQNRWRGEIVGPHGSGKSTLVQSLIPLLIDAGRDIKLFTLHRGESRLPVSGTDLQTWRENTQVIIDGYEQLGGWTRTLVSRVCSKQGCGLILTSHAPTGIPLLYRTRPELEVVQKLVQEMQPENNRRVFDSDVARSFERQQGNIREVFFELYDLFEQRRP